MASIDIFTPLADHGEQHFLGTLGGKAAKIIHAVVTEGTGEPVFVLRAQDLFSTMAIKKYLDMLEEFAPNDSDIQADLIEVLEAFKEWQKINRDKVRYPD